MVGASLDAARKCLTGRTDADDARWVSDSCTPPVAHGPRLFRALALMTVMTVTTVMALVAIPEARGSAAPAAAPAPATSPSAPVAPNPSPYPPSAPVALVATSVTSASVTLSWTGSTRGCCAIVGYDINYHQAFGHLIWTVSVGDVTTATITSNISPTLEYTFSVVARDSVGHRSRPSNAVTVVTPVFDRGPDTTPPDAPTNLAATAVPAGGAVLTWSPATDNVGTTGYTIDLFDGSFIPRNVVTVAGTTYTVPPSLTPTRFYVRARDGAGNISIASSAPIPSPATVPPTTPAADPLTCRTGYATVAEWKSGFVAGVTITNTGRVPVTGWTLAFTFGGDQQVASSWNATFNQSGSTVTMKPAAWNSVIAPGGSASIGMQGTWAASNSQPSAFTLNGVPCAIA